MRTETVTSAQNAKIKALLALQEKSRARKEAGLFLCIVFCRLVSIDV